MKCSTSTVACLLKHISQVLTNAQGRSIELLTCYVQSSGVMLLVSPHMREAVHQRLDKYILYGDQVGYASQWGPPACCMAWGWGGSAALPAICCSGPVWGLLACLVACEVLSRYPCLQYCEPARVALMTSGMQSAALPGAGCHCRCLQQLRHVHADGPKCCLSAARAGSIRGPAPAAPALPQPPQAGGQPRHAGCGRPACR